ncbi:unnamed protein product [Caenorhabditis bovis]|uniref:Uncharacterized protein n=1 Tax=Caenorhabditis bovis TaxID=2654633 RepID=A0A8S1EBR6_9PELO|nr:unnamed protein product [Caenorhabditis bovis]
MTIHRAPWSPAHGKSGDPEQFFSGTDSMSESGSENSIIDGIVEEDNGALQVQLVPPICQIIDYPRLHRLLDFCCVVCEKLTTYDNSADCATKEECVSIANNFLDLIEEDFHQSNTN